MGQPQPSQKEETDTDTLFLKTDNRIVNVNISDIRYVEAMSEYLKVWLDSQTKPIVTLLSM
jgi:DNA-binding LytR/AlgR family response regulator